MQKYVKLRILGKISLGMTVPREFAKTYGLQVGDSALWEIDGDSVRLRFFKVKVEQIPALEAQGEEGTVDAA